MKVREIVNKTFYHVDPDDTILKAKRIMLLHKPECIMVIEGDEVVGIVLPTDLIKEKDDNAPISKIMQTTFVSVDADEEVKEAAKLMTNNKLSFLPVMEDGKVIGIITQRDLVEDIVLESKFPKLTPERAAIYLAMSSDREKEEYWLDKCKEENFKAAITQVGANAEQLPIKMRESAIVAAIARSVIKEDPNEKIALSNAVRDAYLQLSSVNPGLGGGFKLAIVRGWGRICVAAFGRCGHALANSPMQIVTGFSIISSSEEGTN